MGADVWAESPDGPLKSPPRHGALPHDAARRLPGLGAARGCGRGHRHLQRLVGGWHAARPRSATAPGTATCPVPRRGDEYRFVLRAGGRDAVADRPLRPRGDHVRRQRHRRRARSGRRRLRAPGVEPPGHLRDAHRHLRPRGRRDRHVRGRRRGASTTSAASAVNAVQVMPVAEFAGDVSWGYNPAHIFAVEHAYGGPEGLKEFVRAAHEAGIAVILDVVYNHFGPSDLDLWRFDGWSENDSGGIYFYNDWRAETPWGETRPDYGRREVRQFIRDNAMIWLEEYDIDGLRFDMTLYIRSVRGDDDAGDDLADGWSLMQWINDEIAARLPGRITIAEDLRNNAGMTAAPADGGCGFGSAVGRPVRPPDPRDAHRRRRRGPLHGHGRRTRSRHRYNDDAFQRVIYTESHDEVANGTRPRSARDRARRPRPLRRAEALDPRRRAGLHRARHPDAVPGPGVPGGRLVPRHRPARLGQERRVPRHRPPLPRPDPPPPRPPRHHRRPHRARTSPCTASTTPPRSWPSTAGPRAARRRRGRRRQLPPRAPRRLPHRLPEARHLEAPPEHRLDRLQRRLHRPAPPATSRRSRRRATAIRGRPRSPSPPGAP